MNRRVVITRDVAQEIKDLLATLLEKSLVDIRGDVPFTMRDLVKRFDLTSTNIIDMERQTLRRELFRDESINSLMDSTYIDHYIQYVDAFTLQDLLYRIRGLFDSGIMSAIMKAGELKSRMRDYSKLAAEQYAFTDVYHNSFNELYNGAPASVKLAQNAAAGIIRLQGLEQNFGEPDHSNIKLSLISTDPEIIDETDPVNAYNKDMMSPYYITAIAYGNPTNPDYGTINFGEYDGILVKLEIKLAGIYPINRISLAQFSTSPFDVVKIYCSEKASPVWHIDDLDEITINIISTDNNEVEINFDRVYTRTLWIVLQQRHYLEAQTQVAMDELLSTQEYLTYAGGTLERIAVDGFIECDDQKSIVTEILDNVKTQVQRLTSTVEPHARAYTLGVFNVKAANVAYAQYGEYVGHQEKIRGNVISAKVAFEGEIDTNQSGQIDTAALFSLMLPGDREVFLGQSMAEGNESYVVDVTTIEENTIISGGNLVPDPTYPYRFKTHFLPAMTGSTLPMTIYVDGYEQPIAPTSDQLSWDGNRVEVRLDSSLCNTYNLYDGKIATLRYVIPVTDRTGRSYSVDEVDIVKALGKPNIKDNTACELGDRYLYHVSGTVYVSYEPDEWFPCYIEGEEDTVYYCIGTGKGEAPVSNLVYSVGGRLFLHESLVIPPYDDFYYGATNDEPVYQSSTISYGGKLYRVYKTDLAYVKGTLKAYIDGAHTVEVLEYDTDVLGSILTTEQKRTVYIYVPEPSTSEVRVSYIPLDVDDPGSGYVNTNIAQHTNMERFTETVNKKVVLSRYSYHDNTIVRSPTFALNKGVFFLKRKYSVVYEPIVVYINGIKATNVHDYQTGGAPQFKEKVRATDYQYYFENGDTLVFNEDLKGSIIVYYYTISDAFVPKVRLYRSNTFRDDQTPELYNYTILTNIQRH